MVAPASAATLPDITSLPGKVTLTYDGATLDVVTVKLPLNGTTCAVSDTNGWTTRVVGRATKVNGSKVRPVTVSAPNCGTADFVSWTVTATNLAAMKKKTANAVVKFIASKDSTQTVQTLVVKIGPVGGKVTGKR